MVAGEQEKPPLQETRGLLGLLKELNSVGSPLAVVVWMIWGYLRIPHASSITELRWYEHLTGAAEVPILFLLVATVLSLKPIINSPRGLKQRLRLLTRPVPIGLMLLSAAAVYVWCDRAISNDPPRVTAIRREEAYLVPSVHSTIQVEANDPNGDEVLFLWSSQQIPFEKTGANSVRLKAPPTPGEYLVTVVAFDRKGAYDIKEVSIHVVGQFSE